MSNAILTVMIGDYVYTGTGQGTTINWSPYRSYLSTRQKKSFDVYIRSYKIEQNPDFFTSVSTKNYDVIKNFFYDTAIKAFKTYNRDEANVYDLVIYLDPYILKETYSRKNLFEIIAQCGAMFNVVTSFGTIFFLKYNRSVFYKKHKKWENINESMTGRDGDEKEEEEDMDNKTIRISHLKSIAKKRTITKDVYSMEDANAFKADQEFPVRNIKRGGKQFIGATIDDS
eukprot:TRINITY_DN8698_c0_g1_i9.p1 TRINITY_DN8698_c0_g1~~TRINITY_DN8698_c0_g1_i9.p1  ORF type:complete len:228 (-),score=37.14 TRINITY_DN8698_c0_g1_i9:119-802(-)